MTANILANAKIKSLLSVETLIKADAAHADQIEGAVPHALDHDGTVVECLSVPACSSPPIVKDGVVENLPDAEDGVLYLVPAVVFSNVHNRSDVIQYDNATNIKNIPPLRGVAYQTSFITK